MVSVYRSVSTVLACSLLFAGVMGMPSAVSAQKRPDRGPLDEHAKTLIVQRDFTVQEPEIYVSDEFVVVLSREARQDIKVGSDVFGKPTASVADLQQAIDRNGVQRFARQFPTAKPRAQGSKYPDLTGHFKVKLDQGVDLKQAIREFESSPSVDHVEKIGVHFVTAIPNDTYYDNPPPSFPNDQWHYWDTHGIDADLAWDTETGDSNVVVAIADSGVRYFHLDLGGDNAVWGPGAPQTNGNIWVNAGEIPGNGQDDDGNGYVDDTIGYDFVSSTSAAGCSCLDDDCGTADNDPDDYDGHGTHLAGTAGAITNNARIVAGVAGGFSDGTTSGAGNGVKIMPLRIGWHARCMGVRTGVVRMDYAAEAFNYIADQVDAGVNVAAVNASWGSSNSGGLGAATDNLIARDVVITYAAGNSNSTSTGYLGGRSDVLTVAATNRNGNGASFSNHGSTVDIAAPGEEILSTYRNPDDPDPNAHYLAVLDGTSMAAPHCAGVAALLESCDPGLTRAQKMSLMISNVTSYSDGRDLGSGILNANLALAAAGCSGGCTTNADCDDGNACNGAETCVGGSCQSGTPVNCDDGDACTADSCNPGTGACSNTPINCDDGDSCTVDSCDIVTGCANDPIDCSDGDLCTADSCSGGVCSNDPIDCDDGDACTADSCDSGSGCVNTDPPCQDNDDCCPSGCDVDNDNDCSSTCGERNDPCNSNADCCSNKCKGNGLCR